LDLELGDQRHEVVATVTWINDGRDPKSKELPPGFGVRITQIGLPAKLAIVNALKRSKERRPPT
jgi:hypothetical protein